MKTIMIQDTVYQELSAVKGDKSFSELFEDMLNQIKESKAYKMELLNRIRGTMTDQEAKLALERIKKLRENWM
jgi:predicted CopG family antitoxin